MDSGKRGRDMLNQAQNSSAASSRKDDTDIRTSFRAERLFSIGTNWYFSTREGQDQGPFLSKQMALNAIDDYINDMQVKNEFE